MRRSADATRRHITDAAYESFSREGFARVGMEAIAAAAGVTKRCLYNHFESKDALLAAVLESQRARMLDWAADVPPSAATDPEALVDALFGRFEAWATQPRWHGSGFTRAAMELAALPGHPARVAARRQKAAVERWLGDRLAAAGVDAPAQRAREVVLLLEGCNALTLIHGDPGYVRDAAAAARRLLAGARRPRYLSAPRARG